jgi:hypothetical protein
MRINTNPSLRLNHRETMRMMRFNGINHQQDNNLNKTNRKDQSKKHLKKIIVCSINITCHPHSLKITNSRRRRFYRAT